MASGAYIRKKREEKNIQCSRLLKTDHLWRMKTDKVLLLVNWIHFLRQRSGKDH